MPLYDYDCTKGHRFERYLPLADYATPQVCECGASATKRVTAALVVTDLPGYQSPVDGRWVEGRRARREDLARNNCVPYEPSMKDEMLRNRQKADDKLGRDIEHHFDAAVSQMPARKRELLEQEIRSGADVEFTRA